MEPRVSGGASTEPQFEERYFPLVVCLAPREWGPNSMRRLISGYERNFRRGQRYVMINAAPTGAQSMGARERSEIATWSNAPEVRKKTGELCVGASTLVRDAIARGAMTAILWIWKPPSPHHVTSSPEECVDWALEKLRSASLSLPAPEGEVRASMLALLRA